MNNYEQMRKALVYARTVLAKWLMDTPFGAWNELGEAIDKCDAALALPPRQCDVGTAEEQEERWHKNCGDEIPDCKNCKVYGQAKESGLVGDRGFLRCSCRFIWAQMPYAEEGGAV